MDVLRIFAATRNIYLLFFGSLQKITVKVFQVFHIVYFYFYFFLIWQLLNCSLFVFFGTIVLFLFFLIHIKRVTQ